MNIADLRPFVLEALRKEPDTQFITVEHQVADLAPDYKPHDALVIREIIWELLIQGILAPGFNSSNLNFPFIHVTEYGKRCLEVNTVLPHDPDRYMERLQQQIAQPIDDILQTYVRESLLTFLAGRYLASAVMLGVASERCVDMLIDTYVNALNDACQKTAFEKKTKQAGRSVKRRFDVLRDELLALSLPPELKDALDIQLSGIFTLIRYTRNDAGHPTGRTIGRDAAHGNILLFPQYYKRANELIEHFQANSA